jgi:hypothetical protein
MAPAPKYVLNPDRAAQIEGQKQGMLPRFSSTGAHDILESTTKNIEQWVRLRFALWYWLCTIGNAFETCHDAAENEEGGKIKERRRPGKINAVAHEVYGPSNQLNVDAEGDMADGTGPAASIRNLKIALTSSGLPTGLGYRYGTATWSPDT